MNLMTPHEKQELLRLIEKIPTTTRCDDCRYSGGAFCQLVSQKIPDNVLEIGCEAWEFNPNSPPF